MSRSFEGHQFIRLSARETWIKKILTNSKRDLFVGGETKESPEKKLRREQRSEMLASDVCNDLLSKLQQAVGAARKETPYGKKGAFPKVLTIEIAGCSVKANTQARLFHVVVNQKALVWIQTGLRKSVTELMESRAKAISHTESTDEIPKGFYHLNFRQSVRGKVHWVPHKLAWAITFQGVPGEDKRFCRMHGLRLDVDKTLGGHEFQLAREKAFEVACRLWNEVDQSNRRKMKGIGRKLPFMAISHTQHWWLDEEDSRCSGSEEE